MLQKRVISSEAENVFAKSKMCLEQEFVILHVVKNLCVQSDSSHCSKGARQNDKLRLLRAFSSLRQCELFLQFTNGGHRSDAEI